jgi:alkylated DNA repair dioxygenase AlkB
MGMFDGPLKLAAPDGDFRYFPAWLKPERGRPVVSRVSCTDLPWESQTIRLFGKEVLIPRQEVFFATATDLTYGYSGNRLKTHQLTGELLTLLERINRTHELEFNCVLCNLYRDGHDSNGWHADNEPELGENPSIASVSFGASRKFELRHNQTRETFRFSLESGSLLLMGDGSQLRYQHRIPKEPKIGYAAN